MKAYRTIYHENPILIFEGSEKDCRAAIVKDYTNRGEKSYYWNCYSPEEGVEVIDYGSYSIFYHLVNK